MANKTTSETSTKTVETVQSLIAGALDEENEEESRSKAVQALRMLKKHDLRIVSGADMQAAERAVEQARKIAEEAKSESRKNMLIGGALGYFLSKGKLF
jgi:hypothetical protein